MRGLHVDFVRRDWGGMQETLMERLPGDSPMAGKSGDYAYYSEPHSMADCPFTDSNQESPARAAAMRIAESWARHFPANQKCSVLARAYLDSEAKLMALREAGVELSDRIVLSVGGGLMLMVGSEIIVDAFRRALVAASEEKGEWPKAR